MNMNYNMSSNDSNNNSINIKLCNLPLKPNTLSILLRYGFTTTLDIDNAKRHGGLSNFAMELGECTLSMAASIQREVESARQLVMTGNGFITRNEREDMGINNNKSSSSSSSSVSGGGGDGTSNAGDNTPDNSAAGTTNTAAAATSTSSRCSPTSVVVASSSSSSFYSSSSAADILKTHVNLRPIVTFCRSIDTLLGGGFALCEVTELVGIPGIGKTQFCMQLCVDARLPFHYGGVSGESIYIDTEGSFAPERCLKMANALVNHVRMKARDRKARKKKKKMMMMMKQQQQKLNHHHYRNDSNIDIDTAEDDVPAWFEPENILNGIHVYRVHDETSQNATIRSLPIFLQEKLDQAAAAAAASDSASLASDSSNCVGAPVRLVVIDSMAFHYRTNSDLKSRTRSLAFMSSFLSELATRFRVAIVVVNQMTTKVLSGGAGGGSNNSKNSGDGGDGGGGGDNNCIIVPALGESWAHATTTRLLLTMSNNNNRNNQSSSSNVEGGIATTGGGNNKNGIRRCTLVKSPHKPPGDAYYRITDVGIRDV